MKSHFRRTIWGKNGVLIIATLSLPYYMYMITRQSPLIVYTINSSKFINDPKLTTRFDTEQTFGNPLPTRSSISSLVDEGQKYSHIGHNTGEDRRDGIEMSDATSYESIATQHLRHYVSNSTTLLEDIRASAKRRQLPSCGNYKCFVISQSFPQDYGYTVGQHKSQLNSYTAEIMFLTFQYVKRLERDLNGINHMYVTDISPVVMPMNESENLYQYLREERHRAERKNQYHAKKQKKNQITTNNHILQIPRIDNNATTRSSHNSPPVWSMPSPIQGQKYRTLRYSHSKDFLVQVFRQIPRNAFLFRLSEHSQEQFKLGQKWIQTLHKEGLIKDLANFSQRLQDQIHYNSYQVLEQEPRLAFDYQIAVDTQGLIWHFDLDRAIGYDFYYRNPPEVIEKRTQKRKLEAQVALEYWHMGIQQSIRQSILQQASVVNNEDGPENSLHDRIEDLEERVQELESGLMLALAK